MRLLVLDSRFGLSLSQDAFASPEKNPNNECFCIHKKMNKRHRCKVNGIMDLGGCQNKAPLILSGPHFLDTDPDLSKLVDGLTPDPSIHATYVDIEPVIFIPYLTCYIRSHESSLRAKKDFSHLNTF